MKRPNVVFILIDDMGWKDISCMGSEFYETPNIDRIASEGLLFTDAYAACPVCSPTRASIMSGQYPARVGMTNFCGQTPGFADEGTQKGRLLSAPFIPFLPTSEKSLGKAMQENGYQTWHVGKWHMGEKEKYWPDQHGFDVNIAGCHMGGPGSYFAPFSMPTLPPKPDDDYLTDRLGDEAVKLIKESGDQPFFLNMWFYQVHTPLMAKEEKVEKYKQKIKRMGLDKVDPIYIKGDISPDLSHEGRKITRRMVQSEPVYAAMIEHLDENVGKILDALDEKGIADNTLLIFTSDNGGASTGVCHTVIPTSNAPLSEGKGWLYDGGTREPLLIRWPGVVKPGTTTDAIVSSPDFYPTILEACGLPLESEQHVDGRSFYPVIRNSDMEYERDPIFWHFPHYHGRGGAPGCAIRRGDWKLIEFFEGSVELYNLKDDISETTNLVSEQPELT